MAAGIPPLNLRYCEIAIGDIAKISAKKSTYPLKAKLDQYTHDSELWNEKYVSPIGLAVCQAIEMKRFTGIDMQFVSSVKVPFANVLKGQLIGVSWAPQKTEVQTSKRPVKM